MLRFEDEGAVVRVYRDDVLVATARLEPVGWVIRAPDGYEEWQCHTRNGVEAWARRRYATGSGA